MRELLDDDNSLQLARESRHLGCELGVVEAEANAQIDIAVNLTALGERQCALDQLPAAERLQEDDIWFRRWYRIRLKAGDSTPTYCQGRARTRSYGVIAKRPGGRGEPLPKDVAIPWKARLPCCSLANILVCQQTRRTET